MAGKILETSDLFCLALMDSSKKNLGSQLFRSKLFTVQHIPVCVSCTIRMESIVNKVLERLRLHKPHVERALRFLLLPNELLFVETTGLLSPISFVDSSSATFLDRVNQALFVVPVQAQYNQNDCIQMLYLNMPTHFNIATKNRKNAARTSSQSQPFNDSNSSSPVLAIVIALLADLELYSWWFTSKSHGLAASAIPMKEALATVPFVNLLRTIV